MAKVVLATMGSLGDLNPFLAIGIALKRIGHAPVVVTHDFHQSAVEECGLAYRPVRPSLQELLDHTGLDLSELVVRAARDPWFLLRDVYLPFTPRIYEDVVAASGGASLIVAHNWLFGALIAAEAQGIPLVRVALSPIFLQSAVRPSETGGIPYLPRPRSGLGMAYNRAVREIARREIGRKMGPAYAFRRALGLAESSADFVFDFGRGGSVGSVIGTYSPHFAGIEADHNQDAFLSGFPHFDGPPKEDRQTRALRRFLAEGPAPVVLTLGSFVVEASSDFYANGLAACRALGLRSVLIAGEAEAARLGAMSGPDTFICAYARHSEVFPHAAAIVHHGGIGTTGQAIRSGKPQLVVPMLGDQADNGRRLVEHGVARRLMVTRRFGRDKASIARMIREIGSLVGDPRYCAAATALAKKVAGEDGARTAALHLDQLIAGEGPQAAAA